MNIRTLAQFLFSLLLMHGSLVQGAEEDDHLANLENVLAEDVSKILGRYEELLGKLRKNYTSALSRMEKELAPEGDLDPILVVRKEKAAVAKEVMPLPELPADAPPKLLALRKTFDSAEAGYARQRDTALSKLSDEYDRAYFKLEEFLTRRGDLDGAVAVRRAREALVKDLRFPKAALATQLKRDIHELTQNLEESTWEWRPTDPKVARKGLLLSFRKGGVTELNWHPERGRWKVVSASEVELSSDRWDKASVLTFDKGLKSWELRLKGEDKVRVHGQKKTK